MRGLVGQLTMCVVVTGIVVHASADDHAEACRNPTYRHGHSYILPLEYGEDFRHFGYTNPDAPKQGTIRVPQMGTFDNFNVIVEKGRLAAGYQIDAGVVYDRLMEPSIDEPASQYGRLAEGVATADDLAWVAFKLRDTPRWHDGAPITAADVVFTFEAMRAHGSVANKTVMTEIAAVFAFGEREVCFVRNQERELNPALPFAIGNYSILPKHYWESRDISKTTVEAPLASGPYRVERYDLGRYLVYERVEDYWGRDIPVNRGRFNFDVLKYDYFNDENVMMEAHKANTFDVREDGVSKSWATNYDFPAVRAGLFKKELTPLARTEGLWWPVIWNIERAHLADIRVREALWLLFDFQWTNRVLFYDFYDTGYSFFQNSPMAAEGLPSEAELELLEPWRGQIPDRVFTEPIAPPPATGFGRQRDNVKRALMLFKEAGWEIQDGVMRNVTTGEPFTLNFIGVSKYSIRQNLSLVDNLERVGIATTGVAPEVSQWLYRSRTGKFDGNSVRWRPGEMPGLQLRNWFGSAAADLDFGRNWIRLRHPAVDHLIERIIAARTVDELYSATRALDRVLMWGFYFVPFGTQPGSRLVYWDKFGRADRGKALSRVPHVDAWWWDADKAQRVSAGLANLESD